MSLPALALLGSLFVAPAAAEAGESVEVTSNPLATYNRVYVETSVQLPRFMWFLEDFNRDIRVSSFEVELDMMCEQIGETRRRTEVGCRIQQAAVRAAPLSGDQRLAPPVLDQMRDKLTGALVLFQVRRDGRITNVNLRDAFRQDQRHRRIRLMHENLRLVVMRAVAGLDFQRPKSGVVDGEIWSQRQSLLTMAPTAIGTLGATELVYRAEPGPEDLLTVRGEGTAMIVPADGRSRPADLFDSRVVTQALVEPETGRISSVAWTVIGRPTPSSAIAEGPEGLPYIQRGRAVALRPGESATIGETGVIEPGGLQPTAIQQDRSLGVQR